MTEVQPILDEAPGWATVRGFLHPPVSPARGALVLTHGAGSNANAPVLVAFATVFAEAGYHVLRCDLPFRQLRERVPPRGTGALDREGLGRAVEVLRKIARCPVWLGGHSYGGRQATMLAAEEPDLAAALLLLSYPLHPPNRPAQPRTAHFSNLRTPALFVHGTRDPFGSLDEMRAALVSIPARVELLPIEAAGHDLSRGTHLAVARQACEAFLKMVVA